jgi:hypothetical protein
MLLPSVLVATLPGRGNRAGRGHSLGHTTNCTELPHSGVPAQEAMPRAQSYPGGRVPTEGTVAGWGSEEGQGWGELAQGEGLLAGLRCGWGCDRVLGDGWEQGEGLGAGLRLGWGDVEPDMAGLRGRTLGGRAWGSEQSEKGGGRALA